MIRRDSIGRVIGATPIDRFATFVDVQAPGCWRWTGKHDRNGYGRFRLAGRWQLAHRVAVTLLTERDLTDLEVDHLCQVKDCVNPDHLDLVTPQQNMHRQARVGARASATHCKRGHEFTEANTYRNARGNRDCITCRRAARAARYAKEKAS